MSKPDLSVNLAGVVLNNPVKQGYEFEGWYVGNSVSCDYSTKITEIDGSTQSGVLYLYPKVIAKEWFVYIYNDSSMTAILKFTNKATEMNEFYIPAEYNGYKVAGITFPSSGTDASLTNKLNTDSKFIPSPHYTVPCFLDGRASLFVYSISYA